MIPVRVGLAFAATERALECVSHSDATNVDLEINRNEF